MPRQNPNRVLAIAPISRGFGYVLLDETKVLADWGLKILDGKEKNVRALSHVTRLIMVYKPSVLVIEDFWQGSSKRANRIRLFGEELLSLAKQHQIATKVLQRQRIWPALVGHNRPTKFEVAKVMAAHFADDLGFSLPEKRKLWKGEDNRFAIFVAAALALGMQLKKGFS